MTTEFPRGIIICFMLPSTADGRRMGELFGMREDWYFGILVFMDCVSLL